MEAAEQPHGHVSVSGAQFDVQMYTNDAGLKIEPQPVGMELSQGLSLSQ
jgi:hypothetical protein